MYCAIMFVHKRAELLKRIVNAETAVFIYGNICGWMSESPLQHIFNDIINGGHQQWVCFDSACLQNMARTFF